MKVLEISNAHPSSLNYTFYCPGCKENHGFKTTPSPGPQWTFNGDCEKPTVRPSILTRFGKGDGVDGIENYRNMVCHIFITDGKIQYLSDCTHELAGQTIEMEDL